MAQDPRRALNNTGRLVIGITSPIAGAYPYGGTELGIVGKVEVVAPNGYARLTQEETGRTTKVLAVGSPMLVRGEAVEWHAETLDFLFGAGSVPVGAERVIELPAPGAGKDVPPTARVLFAPRDSETDLAVLVYSAVPMVDLNNAMRASAYTYWSLPFVLEALADADAVGVRIGRIADLITVGA